MFDKFLTLVATNHPFSKLSVGANIAADHIVARVVRIIPNEITDLRFNEELCPKGPRKIPDKLIQQVGHLVGH